ncbi:hypothetical protein HanXRQr2_Chr13g0578281 [Helianthus annuus]|uniref:Uncharacterized protein n=1 Tax=Helianthus annuus TaxID=4232 RepID=A0A9K3HB81_HELAN|nr:hypothetical protein HanXRQr2_Chr13g0578281 [Helianthus annuus]
MTQIGNRNFLKILLKNRNFMQSMVKDRTFLKVNLRWWWRVVKHHRRVLIRVTKRKQIGVLLVKTQRQLSCFRHIAHRGILVIWVTLQKLLEAQRTVIKVAGDPPERLILCLRSSRFRQQTFPIFQANTKSLLLEFKIRRNGLQLRPLIFPAAVSGGRKIWVIPRKPFFLGNRFRPFLLRVVLVGDRWRRWSGGGAAVEGGGVGGG